MLVGSRLGQSKTDNACPRFVSHNKRANHYAAERPPNSLNRALYRKASEVCPRIAKITGVGPKTATAIVAAVGDGTEFKNGGIWAAWLGSGPATSRSPSWQAAER